MLITIIKALSRGRDGRNDGCGTAQNQSRYTEKQRKNLGIIIVRLFDLGKEVYVHLLLVTPVASLAMTGS